MNKKLDELIHVLSASIEALRTTVPANTEVVLHNLTQPESSVISIVNGHVSGRKLSDGLLTGPDDDAGFLGLMDASKREPSRVFNGYTTTTSAGKVLNSASTIYYSKDGVPLCAFCINVDFNAVNRLKRELDYLIQASTPAISNEDNPANIPEQPLDEVLAQYRQTGAENNMDFRKRVVSEIHAMGFFKIKGSVNHVAKALGVTRYTIYNYLEKINEKE